MNRDNVARYVSAARVAVAALALLPIAASAGDVLSDEQCGSCHRLEAPAPGQQSVEAYAERLGPDLYYAGSKFQRDWLRKWLVAPERIRPAGLAPYRHVKSVEGKDLVDDSDLPDHPKLAASRVDAVVAALEELDWGAERLPESLPAAPPVPRMLAEMNFVKFKGCASCHRIGPDRGGLSGPELYSATQRLRPEFLVSYITDPQAWDAVAPMPGYGLPEVEVAKLIHYLRLLSEEREDALQD